jgi:hypothetical protein
MLELRGLDVLHDVEKLEIVGRRRASGRDWTRRIQEASEWRSGARDLRRAEAFQGFSARSCHANPAELYRPRVRECELCILS